jgi:hypothetical protein
VFSKEKISHLFEEGSRYFGLIADSISIMKPPIVRWGLFSAPVLELLPD